MRAAANLAASSSVTFPEATGRYRVANPADSAARPISAKSGWSVPSPSGRLQMIDRKPCADSVATSEGVICLATQRASTSLCDF